MVEIYKGKGPLTDPASYRPISLLSTSCKLFAKLLHSRLQAALDEGDPIRVQGNTLYLTADTHHFADLSNERRPQGNHFTPSCSTGKKAFDKIHPEALLTALTRHGVPPHFTALIKNIYTSPQFTVAAAGKQSSTAEASAGIRQGCPLSPYLFS